MAHFSVILLLLSGLCLGAGKHAHGEVDLQLVWEKQFGVIQFSLPLADAIGTENWPTTAADLSTFSQWSMKSQVALSERLFSLTLPADCFKVLTQMQIREDGHLVWQGEWRWFCTHQAVIPPKLTYDFSSLKIFKKINLTALTPEKSITLEMKTRQGSWSPP